MANPWDFDTIWAHYCEDYPDFGEGLDCPVDVPSGTPIDGSQYCRYVSGGEVRKYITEVSGLWHLEGLTVSIITDGGEHPQKTVVNGTISLDYPAIVVHVGLPYLGLLKGMNLEGGGIQGPAQTKPKNINRVGIRFLNTLGAEYGTDLYNMTEIVFRENVDFTDLPPPLFTGDKRLVVDDDTSLEKHLYILQRHPLPCTVLLTSPFIETDNE